MPGVIESYIHTGNQTGVLVEINCQNKITATTSEFKILAKEIARQIAGSPQVMYTKLSDIPPQAIKQIDRQIQQKENKQELLQQKIQEICLYEQPYIRDNSITVEDLVKLHIAQLSEQITISRFVRFTIDESYPISPGNSGGIPVNPSPDFPPFTEETKPE